MISMKLIDISVRPACIHELYSTDKMAGEWNCSNVRLIYSFPSNSTALSPLIAGKDSPLNYEALLLAGHRASREIYENSQQNRFSELTGLREGQRNLCEIINNSVLYSTLRNAGNIEPSLSNYEGNIEVRYTNLGGKSL